MNPVFGSVLAQIGYEAMKELFASPQRDDNDALTRIADALESLVELNRIATRRLSAIERIVSRQ